MPKIKPLLKHKKYLIAAVICFAAWELTVVHFMYNFAFSLFSYICIISSCLFCAVLSDGSRVWLFTQLGLIGTVGADFFLVFLPFQLRVPGLIFFCCTQIAYGARVFYEDRDRIRKRVHWILRISACVIGLIITPVVLGSRVDAVAMLSVFYYANLLCNVLFSLMNFKQSGLFALALLAFVLSDTLLGFQSLSDYFLIPRGSFIYYVVFFGKKIFYPLYIVSQVTIPISIALRRLKSMKADSAKCS